MSEDKRKRRAEYSAKYRAANRGRLDQAVTEWRRNNKERANEIAAKYRANNRELLSQKHTKWHADNPEWRAQWRLKNRERLKEAKKLSNLRAKLRRFGWIIDDYETAVAMGCAICGEAFGNSRFSTPRLDHCHRTGVARGLLCHHCNLALGLFKDRPEILDAAAGYLRRPEAEVSGQ